MSEREEKRGGLGCIIMGMVAFMLLPLYVLGVGPAVWLDNRFVGGIQFLRVVYKPLLLLMQRCEPVDDVVIWYINFWQ